MELSKAACVGVHVCVHLHQPFFFFQHVAEDCCRKRRSGAASVECGAMGQRRKTYANECILPDKRRWPCVCVCTCVTKLTCDISFLDQPLLLPLRWCHVSNYVPSVALRYTTCVLLNDPRGTNLSLWTPHYIDSLCFSYSFANYLRFFLLLSRSDSTERLMPASG